MNIDGWLEPDLGPTPYHRRIMKAVKIPGTLRGNRITLACGHTMVSYGDLKHARDGAVMCTDCRDQGEKP